MDEAQKQAMAEAVAKIRENMTAAAKAAGRDPSEVLLCAACKTRTVEEVRYSADLPIDLFGENHVQELVEKTDAGAYNGKPGHFIGHLQTNKVNKVVGRAALIQSVDAGNPDGDQHRCRGKQKRRRPRRPVAAAGRCCRKAAH